MLETKILYAASSSGLCNRLLLLAGSRRIAAKTGRRLILHWPVNDQLGASYSELFATPITLAGAGDLELLLRTDHTVKVYNAWHCPDEEHYSHMSEDGCRYADIVVVKGWIYPTWDSEPSNFEISAQIRPFLRDFEIRPELLRRVMAVSLPPGVLGVHIRRGDTPEVFGDSSDGHFVAIMNALLRRFPNLRFFLSTDVAETEHKFRARFGDHILSQVKTWAARDTLAGGREAAIDLTLLARTAAILGTTQSTFSSTPAILGGTTVVTANASTAGPRCEECVAALSECIQACRNGTGNSRPLRLIE